MKKFLGVSNLTKLYSWKHGTREASPDNKKNQNNQGSTVIKTITKLLNKIGDPSPI